MICRNRNLMTRMCVAVVSIVAVCTSATVFAQEYVEIAKLTAPGAAAHAHFGQSVAISGDIMVVGSPDEDCGGENYCGAAYVYGFDGTTWTQQAKLTTSDAPLSFGSSVSVSGDTIVVATPYDDYCAPLFACGSAYVFVKPGGGWSDMTQTAKLTASDAAANDFFGLSVSISGDTIVAGAPQDDRAPGNDCGSAYVFVKPGGDWTDMTETAKLTASDAAVNDYFGGFVSISGDTIVATAIGDDSGSAYVFVKPGGAWINMTQTAKLTASTAPPGTFTFGSSVSISGDVIAVGDRFDFNGASGKGAAYVFVKPGVSWINMTQTAKLTASDGVGGDELGDSIAISGDTVVAGAPNDNCVGGTQCGSAYVFVKPGGGWSNMTQTEKLAASDATGVDIFGHSVSLSGNTIVAGAPWKNCGAGDDCGAAYVFVQPIFVDTDAAGLNDGTTWTNAFRYLQNALATAQPGDQIWVAEGTYKPTDKSCVVNPDCPGGDCAVPVCFWITTARNQTFQLLDGVAMYGGFAGTETSLDQRDIVANPSILSGDVNGDDGANFFNYAENSYHVTTGSGVDSTAVFDGFTISGGNANAPCCTHDRGGGMNNISGSPTVANCRFMSNRCNNYAGAMYNLIGSSPSVTGCTFEGNSAGNSGGGIYNLTGSGGSFINCRFISNSATLSGGAMVNESSSPILVGCEFTDNEAIFGGGIYNWVGSGPAVVNCAFYGNRAVFTGGAMYNSGSGPSLINVIMSGNEANSGGGIYNVDGSNPQLVNCTLSANSVFGLGGGILNASGAANNPNLDNCVLWGNIRDSNGDKGGPFMDESAQLHTVSGAPMVDNSIVQGGWSGAGSNNINANPLFIDPDGPDNTLGTIDDDVRPLPASPAVDAGDSCLVPLDVVDLDGDGNVTELLPFDIVLTPRMEGYAVDMGPHEVPNISGGDCNRNGFVDQLDICSGSSLDVSPADGTPDECTQFDGGCGGNNAWSCNLNWEDNTVPNNGAETYSVTLETPADDACLDIDVTLNTLVIADGASLDMSGQGGCDGDLTVVEPGGLLLDGSLTDTGPCVLGGSSARGGHTPPSLTIRGPGSTTTVLYSMHLEGTVEVVCDSASPINLGGDFDNQCISGLCFNMREGALLLTGDSPAGPDQRFEAAATDAGPVGTIDNAQYAIGTLEIASGADVTFSDTFDNDGNGQGSCTEAVYVSTLRVGSPASITLDNVLVYYETLDPDPLDPGVIVNAIGCGALVPVTCPAVNAAVRFDPTNNRNRYLSINPGNAGQSVALRVSVLSAPSVPSLVLEQRWVGMPVSVPDPPGGGNIFVAPLQCTPLFMNWAAFPTIHVFGPAIVPSTLSPTQYEVVVVPQSCSAFSGAYSAPLSITQAKWGDIVTPFGGISQPNFNDINAIVDKFRNLGSAPTITRVDLVGPGNDGIPNTPNHTVNFGDISACVDAFRTRPYPFTATTCP